MSTILVIDDEHDIVVVFERFLKSLGHAVHSASNAEDGIEKVRGLSPDLVIMDVKLPGMDGLTAVGRIRSFNARVPILVITAHGTLDTAVRATKVGAMDYLTKPIDIDKLRDAVGRALDRTHRSPLVERLRRDEVPKFSGSAMVGQSPPMQEVFKKIAAACRSDSNVLIAGESGTGKELIARAIHDHSRRAGAPLETINCACLPENLVESELFGHAKGAFTGADTAKTGKFEIAHGGTVFLDEISELSAAGQAKLLRFIEEKAFARLGATQKITVDVRVVSATNRRLEDLIRENKFREDLFYRLNSFRIDAPPLRERREDIPLLVAYFIERAGSRGISDEALQILKAYPWPGNVRELRNAMDQSITLAGGNVIEAGHLPESLRAPARGGSSIDDRIHEIVVELLKKETSDVFYKIESRWEKAVLDQVLRSVDGNQLKASELLGINRVTLRKKLRDYGLYDEFGKPRA
jgi:two-component system nitrogen regulation response regulator GlnG